MASSGITSPASTPSRLSVGPPTTTAASSPPADVEQDSDEVLSESKGSAGDDPNSSSTSTHAEEKFRALQHLLERSTAYSTILRNMIESTHLDRTKETPIKPAKSGGRTNKRASDVRKAGPAPKRRKLEAGDAEHSDDPGDGDKPVFPQPKLITGATMKGYQLEGLQWMACLHSNGISGILADEMGLGKTLQTIAFSAFLRESAYQPAFLIVCPLSVLNNWVEEYAKFAPDIPVCMYHGTPEERAEIRRTTLARIPKSSQANSIDKTSEDDDAVLAKSVGKRKGKTGNSGRGRARGRNPRAKTTKRNAREDDEEPEGVEEPEADAEPPSHPVVVTTFEMIMKDRVHLAAYNWGYIVVDEGHRLKNLDSKLMREIKKYNNASRMILTGTPLQNNLSELWALLNFVLPEIFTDIEQFQAMFDLPNLKKTIGEQRSSEIITTLHSILKPFILRRTKADVDLNLPPKKEYVLYAPLSVVQRETYSMILEGGLRAHLIGSEVEEPSKPPVDVDAPRQLRNKDATSHAHALEEDDDKYFDMLENGEFDEKGRQISQTSEDIEALGKKHAHRIATKRVNSMKLQNTVMQLRKVCSHPYLFEWPLDPRTREPALDDRLVSSSGKMMVLERLLDELFRRKHKVLLFSQFTTMLDIIDDWAREMKGWRLCRIDGSTSHFDRKVAMDAFQHGGDAPHAPVLFLLSTRAGGLGINLTAADTVIFYDQDWNPQMDAQAQARAHRIGQTKPVLIFRIVSAHTIETKIMERATEKKELEAVVIAKGKFKAPIAPDVQGKSETIAELANQLLRLEDEKINVVKETGEGAATVISDHDLDILLDRSPEVFTERQKGWTSAGQEEGKRAAFAVYGGLESDRTDALTTMLDNVDADS